MDTVTLMEFMTLALECFGVGLAMGLALASR